MAENQPITEEERFVSLAEVKSMLTQAQVEREELTYEQKLALEHSLRFSRLPLDKALDLVDELNALDYLTETYAYKITDLCPTEVEDLKAIFAKSRLTIGDDEIRQIIDIVLKYYVPEE